MVPVPNPRLVFKAIPNGLPVYGQTVTHDKTPTIDIDNVPLNGGFLVKTIALSIDPFMRNRMREPNTPGDMPEFPLNETITGFGVAKVIRSESSVAKPGEYVYGFMRHEHYSIFNTPSDNDEGMALLGLRIITNEYNIDWRHFVGICGMTGQTAFYGLKDACSPKPGETILIPAAAGAVGHVLVQLAKRLGLKVIASCGSDEKVEIVKKLGADHAINYKTQNVNEELKKYGPIDIYFDLVGGPTLEAAIENANKGCRILICGAISTYNADMSQAYGVKNLWLLSRHRIKMQGYVVIDWEEKYGAEFYATIPKMVKEGELKPLETVYKSLEEGAQGMIDVLTGANIGKAVVELPDA